MEFLRTVEGKNGEELTTACLGFLLEHSTVIRKAVLTKIAPAITSMSNELRRIQTEFGTEDVVAKESGSLDLIVELSDCVIGIENKLGAGFQPRQPFKYWETIHRIAGSRRAELVVLAPRQRRDEIEEHLRTGAPCVAFVAWEDVLEALAGTIEATPKLAVIRDELYRYLKDTLEFFEGFEGKLEQLSQPIEQTANETQGALLARVWEYFRPADRYGPMTYRPRPKKNASYGGYFLRGAVDYGWYGFLNAARLRLDDPHAKFAIGVQEPLAGRIREGSFARTLNELGLVPTHQPKNWGPNWWAWSLTLTADFRDEARWKELVEPIHAAVETLPENERLRISGRVPNSPA